MKKRSSSFAIWYGAGAVTVVGLLVACGGKVTWVEDGATQSGGAGGTGSTSSKSSTKSVTSTTNVSVVQGSTVQQGTSVVGTSIVSSGNVMPGCDTGEFNSVDSQVCDNCTSCSLGSFCAFQWNAFQSSADAQEFIDCAENCNGPMCLDQCQSQHPMGAQIYFQLVECAYCQACPNNCGADSGCFGPPPPNGTSAQGGGPGSGGGPPPK